MTVIPESLPALTAALRARECTAGEVLDHALERIREVEPPSGAWIVVDEEGARRAARDADMRLEAATGGSAGAGRPPVGRKGPNPTPPGPLCGVPVSVKDLYGVDGLPTYAGTSHQLPPRWERDGWLVRLLRDQGAVILGKTHTVEMAYSGVGINPWHGTPRNPCDDTVHRIPGGSSSGAGVSLREGSARVALGTDTGGSIRIPASMTGTVGLRSTTGRWSTAGVVPLSRTLDTVGGLTRTVEDTVWFFGAVDPAWGCPSRLADHLDTLPGGRGAERPPRVGVPEGGVWEACQGDIERVLRDVLGRLAGVGWDVSGSDGALLDQAAELYLTGHIAGAEGRDVLRRELPGWAERLHPIVGSRLGVSPDVDSDAYREALSRRRGMMADVPGLFGQADVLVLPGHLLTPPPVAELDDPERYRAANRAALLPTCGASLLGLCAVSLPVGVDSLGMPVGLQLLAREGADEALLAVARGVEATLDGSA